MAKAIPAIMTLAQVGARATSCKALAVFLDASGFLARAAQFATSTKLIFAIERVGVFCQGSLDRLCSQYMACNVGTSDA